MIVTLIVPTVHQSLVCDRKRSKKDINFFNNLYADNITISYQNKNKNENENENKNKNKNKNNF